MRINQFLAKFTGKTRRASEIFITRKEVKVNGEFPEMSTKVSDEDKVEFLKNEKWVTLQNNSEERKILFYKPIFCSTTVFNDKDTNNLFDILPLEYKKFYSTDILGFMDEGLLTLRNFKSGYESFTSKYLLILQNPLSQYQNHKIVDRLSKEASISPLNSADEWEYLKINKNSSVYVFEGPAKDYIWIKKFAKFNDVKIQRSVRIKLGEYLLTENVFEQIKII